MAGFPKVHLADKAKRPHAGIPLNKKIIEELVVKHRGNVSKVADAMGSTRQSVSHVISKDPHLTEVLKGARERWLDDIEESVLSRANESNDTALQCFVLKTQGRHRGWDQDDQRNATKEVANAAFEFILNRQSKA